MTEVYFRVVRSRGKHPNWDAIANEVMIALQQDVRPILIEYCERIVANWEHRPHFAVTLKVTRSFVSVRIDPKGPHREKWLWVSRGTGLYGPKKAKYPIRPKGRAAGGSDVLAFPSHYEPKTKPRGPSYRGPGESSGPTVFAMEVMHPGIKPRHFEEAIGRWARRRFEKTMENAMRRGVRRVRI